MKAPQNPSFTRTLLLSANFRLTIFSFGVNISILNNNNGRDENRPHSTYARSKSIESRISHRREFSLISYDSSMFNPEEFYSEQQIEMATLNTPHKGTARERPVTNAEIDRLRMSATHSRRRQEQARTCQDTRNSVLDWRYLKEFEDYKIA